MAKGDRASRRPLMLLIMDGFGLNSSNSFNAVQAARTPNFDRLWAKYPHTTLDASGLSVGLPQGQMGNSEVGHLNFGAGRVVYQEVTRLDRSISEGDFFSNKALLRSMERVKSQGRSLHLMGLVSDGCVHSSQNHLFALLELCHRNNLDKVFIHAFLDGRDTSPYGGADYVSQLQQKCAAIGVGKLATIIGRYYAMDRDKRWQRTKTAYDLVCRGDGEKTGDFVKTIKDHYARDNTDEFMDPIVSTDASKGSGLVSSGDGVIFFNFRADRARQLCQALTEEKFDGFERFENVIVDLVTLTLYDVTLKAEVAFPQFKLERIFPEIISEVGLRQLKIAETEKYPHVTFFFNGGSERNLKGEDRALIPSPKVATYDMMPEMSALEVTEEVLKRIDSYDVIILNYANCDMVGHTGVFEAAVKAVETVDFGVGKVVSAVLGNGGVVMVTADHGNAEVMRDSDGRPFTAHTTSPVPFILVDDQFDGSLRSGGVLADVAPTMMAYLGLQQPPEMTGEPLTEKVRVL